MTTFVIADLHFGHKGILAMEPVHRPFATLQDHNDELVYRWNCTVRKADTVIVLGDVAFNLEGLKQVDRMHGTKVLVMGNHDTLASETYLKYFKRLAGALEVPRRVILTHIPVARKQLRHRFKLNVHGHLHSRYDMNANEYACVSAERVNLTPVPLDALITERLGEVE